MRQIKSFINLNMGDRTHSAFLIDEIRLQIYIYIYIYNFIKLLRIKLENARNSQLKSKTFLAKTENNLSLLIKWSVRVVFFPFYKMQKMMHWKRLQVARMLFQVVYA